MKQFSKYVGLDVHKEIIALAIAEVDGGEVSAIRNAVNNDFRKVTRAAGNLKRVCFNGKTAGRFEPVFAEAGFETLVLPSSSPAYTLGFEAKLKAWRGVTADTTKKRARKVAGASCG